VSSYEVRTNWLG